MTLYKSILFQTPIWAPTLSDRNVAPKEVSHSMTTVEIMFRKNFFLNDHGEVISYAVLVAEDYTKVWQAKNHFFYVHYNVVYLFYSSILYHANTT